MTARPIAAALLATALLATTPAAAARDRVPAATPIGKAESCIQIRQIRESRVRDDSTIDFVMNGGKVYRNVLPNSCPSLGFEEAFSYRTSLSQLCSVDIITVLRRTGGGAGLGIDRGASCGLGSFQPVKLAKDARSKRK